MIVRVDSGHFVCAGKKGMGKLGWLLSVSHTQQLLCSDKYEPTLLRESHECKIEYQMDLFYLWFLLHFQYLDGPKWTIQRGGLHGSPLSNNDFTRFSVCDTA